MLGSVCAALNSTYEPPSSGGHSIEAWFHRGAAMMAPTASQKRPAMVSRWLRLKGVLSIHSACLLTRFTSWQSPLCRLWTALGQPCTEVVGWGEVQLSLEPALRDNPSTCRQSRFTSSSGARDKSRVVKYVSQAFRVLETSQSTCLKTRVTPVPGRSGGLRSLLTLVTVREHLPYVVGARTAWRCATRCCVSARLFPRGMFLT